MARDDVPPTPQDASDGTEDPRDPTGANPPNPWGSEQAKRDYEARGNARGKNPEGVPDEDD